MTKISLIAVIWVMHCAFCGQLPVNNFGPYQSYYAPYPSMFVVQEPNTQLNDETPPGYQSGGTDELGNPFNTKTFSFQETMTFKIKQLEAKITDLTQQLKATNVKLAEKAEKTALDEKADKTALAEKADKTAMQTALDAKADKTAMQSALDAKADKTAMQSALDAKADKTAMQSALDAKADKTAMQSALDAKADKTEMQSALDAKADKTALDPINTALNTITTPSSLGTIPTSCGDLKTIGFVKSGIFSIMDSKQVKNVYCDFTKTTDAELQKMIGTVDVKSTPIYFHAQMTKVYSAALTTIQFDPIKLNVGTALNPATGIFVAPTPGKYYFAFSGISDSGVKARVLLQMMKTGTRDWILVGEGYGDTTFKTFSMHATLELVKGDQVRLSLTEGRINDAVIRNHFNYVGWLLEENELTV